METRVIVKLSAVIGLRVTVCIGVLEVLMILNGELVMFVVKGG